MHLLITTNVDSIWREAESIIQLGNRIIANFVTHLPSTKIVVLPFWGFVEFRLVEKCLVRFRQ
jgi:hypothetical protein